MNDDKETQSYDRNGNWIEWISYVWNSSAWINDERETQSYNTNNDWVEWILYNWNGSTWINDIKDNTIYDGNNNLVEWGTQDWNGSIWLNDYRYLYTYSSTTDVEEIPGTVTDYSLSNNYPNPFNPSTTISFSLPFESDVLLTIYNSIGEEIAELVNEVKPAGNYDLNFYASHLASGTYIYRIQAGSFAETKKMILLK